MKIAIIGGSGFIGSALAKHFDNPLIISSKNIDQLYKIKNYDIVINLAGKPIVKRWSKKYKKLLYSSRVNTTKQIVEIINNSNVKHFISASAIGYYPNPCVCDEKSHNGDGFLAKLSKDWEEEALRCNKKTTIFRLGVVLGNGGALAKMLPIFKLGLGGVVGDGKQKFSWIDIKDVVLIYKFVIQNQIEGILNISSPLCANNIEFTKILGKVLSKPTILPTPKWVLKAVFGESSEVLLSNQEMKPTKLLEMGYNFEYENLEKSLRSLV